MLSGINRSNLLRTLSIDKSSPAGDVVIAANEVQYRRIICKLAASAVSLTITHPLVTANAWIEARLIGSTARDFVITPVTGSFSLTTAPTTSILIEVFIHSFGA